MDLDFTRTGGEYEYRYVVHSDGDQQPRNTWTTSRPGWRPVWARVESSSTVLLHIKCVCVYTQLRVCRPFTPFFPAGRIHTIGLKASTWLIIYVVRAHAHSFGQARLWEGKGEEIIVDLLSSLARIFNVHTNRAYVRSNLLVHTHRHTDRPEHRHPCGTLHFPRMHVNTTWHPCLPALFTDVFCLPLDY